MRLVSLPWRHFCGSLALMFLWATPYLLPPCSAQVVFITTSLLLFSTKLCLTLCDPMDCNTPGFPVLHHLLELAQTHVHWVSNAIQLSLSPLPIPKKGNAKECSNYCTIALISHASKVMLKILQARLQQNVNHELPDVQAGFRKGRGSRDQIANIRWIMEKAREFQKNIYFPRVNDPPYNAFDSQTFCTLKSAGNLGKMTPGPTHSGSA